MLSRDNKENGSQRTAAEGIENQRQPRQSNGNGEPRNGQQPRNNNGNRRNNRGGRDEQRRQDGERRAESERQSRQTAPQQKPNTEEKA